MFEFVQSNVHKIGVPTDYFAINLEEHHIHSGHSFNHMLYSIYYWKVIYTEEFFATRKCRTRHLEVKGFEETPVDLLERLRPREVTWRYNSIPRLPVSSNTSAYFL